MKSNVSPAAVHGRRIAILLPGDASSPFDLVPGTGHWDGAALSIIGPYGGSSYFVYRIPQEKLEAITPCTARALNVEFLIRLDELPPAEERPRSAGGQRGEAAAPRIHLGQESEGLFDRDWYLVPTGDPDEWVVQLEVTHDRMGRTAVAPDRWSFEAARPWVPAEVWDKAVIERAKLEAAGMSHG